MKSNIHLLSGDEDFLVEAALTKLVNNFLGHERGEFDLEILSEPNTDINHLLTACQSLGMFCSKKAIVVKNFFLLLPAKKQKTTITKKLEAQIKYLMEQLMDLSSEIMLVFVVSAKANKQNRFAKFMQKTANKQEFKAFASYESAKIIAFLQNQATKYHKKLSYPVAARLQLLSGENLRLLDSELQKLAVFVGQRAEITIEDVNIMANPASANIFVLLDELVCGNLATVLTLLKKIIHLGEQPIKILGLLVSHFRTLCLLKALNQEGKSLTEIASLVARHPFVVKKNLAAIKAISQEALNAVILELASTDVALKTGQLKPYLALELLCCNTCLKFKT